MCTKSLNAYNNAVRAKRYNTSKGFDPARKERMLDVVVQHLVELTPKKGSLLELGAGTGLLTQKILGTGHCGQIVVTDGAQAMLAIAKQQLQPSTTKTSFDLLNFSRPSWSKRYAAGGFDAVTSSMAIHHIADKQRLFDEVFGLLAVDGVFVFADHLSGSSASVEGLIGRERARVKRKPGRDGTVSEEEIAAFIAADTQKQADEGNLCESVASYLGYLHAAGFRHIDCLWRDYWLAVFVAIK